MNCREAIVEAFKAQQSTLTPRQRKAAAAAQEPGHPLLWAALEKIIIHRYYLATGQKIGGRGFDWSTILQWLITNLPMLITLILTIFGL